MTRPTKDDIGDMRRRRAKGATLEAIAALTGFSKSVVHRATRDIEVDGRIAANRARANIPPPWLAQARRLIRSGLSRRAAAAKLNVPCSTFHRLMDRFL